MTVKPISRTFAAHLLTGVLLAAYGLGAAAQTWSSNPQATLSPKEAKARYQADKKLCADEDTSQARLQCRRDAQAAYNKALAASKASNVYSSKASNGYSSKANNVYSSKAAQVTCNDCGRVTAVRVNEKAGDSNAVGLIAGGVAGAVLGHQVGGGRGKDLATIAGAAGGAYAGKKIQENMNTSKVWTVSVKYTNGHTANFEFAQDPGLRVGEAVRNSGNTLARN